MVQGFGALLFSGIYWILLIVAAHVQATSLGVEPSVRQARCPQALMQLNASPGLIYVSKDDPSTATSTTTKDAVENIEDHLGNVTSKAANATHNISVAAGGALASAWNATEGKAANAEHHIGAAVAGGLASAWNATEGAASKSVSALKHVVGTAAETIINASEEVVSSIEGSMGGTARSSKPSNSTSNKDSKGIVGHFVDAVADDVDGASQAVAKAVSSGWSRANGSKHQASKQQSGVKSSGSCVTQTTENSQAMYSYVAPAGSPCFFGVDDRDEGSHCIDQDRQDGPNGWCWTSEDLESWGKCAAGCPLSGAAKVLEKELKHIEKKLDKLESEISTQ